MAQAARHQGDAARSSGSPGAENRHPVRGRPPSGSTDNRKANPHDGELARCRCPGTSHGAPVGIRTPNLLIRSQMLYPLSYGRNARLAGRLTEDSRPLGGSRNQCRLLRSRFVSDPEGPPRRPIHDESTWHDGGRATDDNGGSGAAGSGPDGRLPGRPEAGADPVAAHPGGHAREHPRAVRGGPRGAGGDGRSVSRGWGVGSGRTTTRARSTAPGPTPGAAPDRP